MASLYIMVTHISRIVPHIIHHGGSYMRRDRIHEIVIIRRRLSLQDIAIIQ